MTPEQIDALVRYRIGQASETLREAEILFKESAFRGAINRAYYSMFYSVLALLVTRQIGTSKHSGVLSLFDREFVKTGIFSRDLSRFIRTAFDRRQTYDYGEIIDADSPTTQEILDNAKIFLSTVKNHLASIGYS